jgi:hypothetical protein
VGEEGMAGWSWASRCESEEEVVQETVSVEG